MTTAAAPSSPLRNWVTGGLLALLAFGACWTGAVLFWRAQQSDPGAVELMVCLFILPGGLLGAALVARKRLADGAGAATPAGARTPAPAKAQPTAPLPLAILASAVRSPHGASTEELADALAGRKARPALDASLVDADGFPVMTARCNDACDADLHAGIAAWLAAGDLPAQFDGEHLRALVLATQVAVELAARAASTLLRDVDPAPLLQLAPVLPPGWTPAQQRAAGLWLRHTIGQAGWPDDRIALLPALADNDNDNDTVPAGLLAQLATRAPGAPVTALLVACASCIGDDTVQAWSATNALFTSACQEGGIPGEGAVGLLLAGAAQPGMLALLEPPCTARRLASADAPRGAISPLLADLAGGALAAAQLDATALAMIVADTGPRTSRMLELMSLGLVDAQDILPVGLASGNCGAVPALTALALAGHHAFARNGPVLWLSNEDPFQRCVAILRPPLS